MNRAPQILDVVDVVRIDAHESGSGVSQKPRRILGQKRMPLEILGVFQCRDHPVSTSTALPDKSSPRGKHTRCRLPAVAAPIF